MLDAILDLGVNEFSLTVSLSPMISLMYGDNAPHILVNNVAESFELLDRLEYVVFKETIDENKNYMYVFKLLPEAE